VLGWYLVRRLRRGSKWAGVVLAAGVLALIILGALMHFFESLSRAV
jgi:hypothetical protein